MHQSCCQWLPYQVDHGSKASVAGPEMEGKGEAGAVPYIFVVQGARNLWTSTPTLPSPALLIISRSYSSSGYVIALSLMNTTPFTELSYLVLERRYRHKRLANQNRSCNSNLFLLRYCSRSNLNIMSKFRVDVSARKS